MIIKACLIIIFIKVRKTPSIIVALKVFCVINDNF